MRLNRRDTGASFLCCGSARVGQFCRNGIALAQTLTTLSFVVSTAGVGAGLLHLCFELAHSSLERTRVDLEQHVALFHQGALGKGDLINLARHARTYFNCFWRFKSPGKFVPFVDRLFQNLSDTDFCCGSRSSRLWSFSACTHYHDGQSRQWEAQMFQ